MGRSGGGSGGGGSSRSGGGGGSRSGGGFSGGSRGGGGFSGGGRSGGGSSSSSHSSSSSSSSGRSGGGSSSSSSGRSGGGISFSSSGRSGSGSSSSSSSYSSSSGYSSDSDSSGSDDGYVAGSNSSPIIISGGGNVSGTTEPGKSGGCSGCGWFIAIFIIIVLMIIGIGKGCGDSGSSSYSSKDSSVKIPEITASTVKREALPYGSVVETGYFTDEAAWITDKSALQSGLITFYEETGVQPYLYILVPNRKTTPSKVYAEAEALYDELFDDEAHFLVVFCDNNSGSYNWACVVGSRANTVMDNEAISIFSDYLDLYYLSDLSEEEFFSTTFSKTAERIMTVTKSPVLAIIIAVCTVIVIIILYFWWKKRKEQEWREAKQTENILNTPLEKFGDKDIEELAKKYEDKT